MSATPKLSWSVAAAMLLTATLELPYGNYKFLRIEICAFCGLVAFFSFNERRINWAIAFTLLAILFDPIIPIYLNRQIWFWLDFGAAAAILAHLFSRSILERRASARRP